MSTADRFRSLDKSATHILVPVRRFRGKWVTATMPVDVANDVRAGLAFQSADAAKSKKERQLTAQHARNHELFAQWERDMEDSLSDRSDSDQIPSLGGPALDRTQIAVLTISAYEKASGREVSLI